MSEIDPRDPDALAGVPLPDARRAVIGHDAALGAITTSLQSGRLPGAFLVHGPQGIGKATLAFAAARQILERTGDEDANRVNEQVDSGAHPNLFVLRRQPRDTGKGHYTVIRVDDIRALRERLRRTRGRAGHRIAIIDSIDDTNPAAANALLKTLEEPPADTLFFLISHRPGGLLPTIRSRCRALALRPLGAPELTQVVAETRPDLDAQTIADAASLAGGRPRRAFEVLGLGDNGGLVGLQRWLAAPERATPAAALSLADALGADLQGPAGQLAQDLILGWLNGEARNAALAGAAQRTRLASATELWEKAQELFADTQTYNLDARQTLTAILDMIRRHARQHPAMSTETS